MQGRDILSYAESVCFQVYMQMPLGSLSPDEALIYAKKEIEKAPLVTDDPDLHAPLFLNVSIFRR